MSQMQASSRNRAARRWPRVLGISLGLLAAMIVLALSGGRATIAPANGPMISECDGRIRSVVLQYVAGSGFVTELYREFLTALPSDVKVYAVCPEAVDFSEFKGKLGPLGDRLEAIFTHHQMTTWSRDRWVALAPSEAVKAVTLVVPLEENGAEVWPQRRGDHLIAGDVAKFLSPNVKVLQTNLNFDGGDFLADSRNVFVTSGAIRRNIQITEKDRDALAKTLERALGKHVVLLDDSPDHHAGMFMMAAGENRVVVGDPSLAKPLMTPIDLPGGADFSQHAQEQFDFVAKAAAGLGYQVTRIPTVSAADAKTYITYLNGIIDQRDSQRMIYLPQYRNQPKLNNAAAKIWEGLGYRIVPIDVTDVFRNFGTLHCLVNVLEKG